MVPELTNFLKSFVFSRHFLPHNGANESHLPLRPRLEEEAPCSGAKVAQGHAKKVDSYSRTFCSSRLRSKGKTLLLPLLQELLFLEPKLSHESTTMPAGCIYDLNGVKCLHQLRSAQLLQTHWSGLGAQAVYSVAKVIWC